METINVINKDKIRVWKQVPVDYDRSEMQSRIEAINEQIKNSQSDIDLAQKTIDELKAKKQAIRDEIDSIFEREEVKTAIAEAVKEPVEVTLQEEKI